MLIVPEADVDELAEETELTPLGRHRSPSILASLHVITFADEDGIKGTKIKPFCRALDHRVLSPIDPYIVFEYSLLLVLFCLGFDVATDKDLSLG